MSDDFEKDEKYQNYLKKKKKDDAKWCAILIAAPFVFLIIIFNINADIANSIGALVGTFWMASMFWVFQRFDRDQAVAILCANIFCLGILFAKVNIWDL